MTAFQDAKRNARRAIHDTMARPAFYIVDDSAPGNPPPTVHVRLHYKFDANSGTGNGYADMREQIPKLIFMRDEVDEPARNAVLTLSTGEGYRIDLIDPPDDLTVKATVVPMSSAEVAELGLPIPTE